MDNNEIKLGLKVRWQGLIGIVVAYSSTDATIRIADELERVSIFELEIADELFDSVGCA